MSSMAQMLSQADALKANISDSSKTISETGVTRQKLEDMYKKILLTDLEYALDKKLEQELWNHAFKNQINNLQAQAKDKQNLKRAEVQATLNLFLETASGFYIQFLQLLCTTFKLDLPCRRKFAYFGVLKEKTPVRLKVTPPKKSSCLYLCQHCLVHLGDIARYRQQIDQAETYYWHAAHLVPFNGQPYNQLAILEAAKGNKLSTVFYYIRSLAVKVPFPVAATNLEKLYIKLTKEISDIKGKPSASEMITGFLQFHALVHLCSDLSKAEELSKKLAAGLSAHVTSQSFPWQVLVQIVAINIFAMNHVQNELNGGGETTLNNGNLKLSGDEENCFNLVFSLTVSMLDILLQYTPKQEHKVCEYFTLPAIKLMLDWFKLNPQLFDRPILKQSLLWDNLCKVLNCIQSSQIKNDDDLNMPQYEAYPLPEDTELRCFQPLEKAQSGYSYSKLPSEGLSVDVEIWLRCHRLLELGHWIITEQPGMNLSVHMTSGSGYGQFTTPTMTVQASGVIKTVTLSVPSSHNSSSTQSIHTSAPSPERRSNRQNVAIQAIMQKQAQNKIPSAEDTPASPKYLLGVPTTEPMFFKASGPRLGPASVSPQSQPTQTVNSNNNKVTGGGGQGGGVLVLKNQEYMTPPSRPSVPQQQQQQTKSWQQLRQATWQQQSKQPEKTSWHDAQTSSQVHNAPPAQWQQQNVPTRMQQSPQSGQGPWMYPGQPNFGRPDFRSRTPMTAQPGFSSREPASTANTSPFFSQGQARPNFPQGHNNSQGQDPFGSDLQYKGQMSLGSIVPNRLSTSNQGGPMSVQNFLPQERFGVPQLGSVERMGLPFGPLFSSMFRHPPPSNRFPPPPNFPGHSPDSGNTQAGMYQGSSQINRPERGNPFPGNSNLLSNQAGTNFPHAPGTERVRDQGQQTPPHIQMPFPQDQFLCPFQGFMGFSSMSNNQLKGSPLESLFVKPQFSTEDIPPNMADIIGTLSKMAVQPPRENVFPAPVIGHTSFQGHAEGTPKPDVYCPQRSSSVPAANVDLDPKVTEATLLSMVTQSQQQQQQQQQGTYSLFSGSPWLSSGDSKSIGSSPFSSESNSVRNSPDSSLDTFPGDMKISQPFEMGLRFGTVDDRNVNTSDTQHFSLNNVQSIWANPSQSPLERLLEIQRQQRQTEPH